MAYLCTCFDGVNALLLRPALFHKEQLETSPLMPLHVRWRLIGDDLPASYLDWTEAVIPESENHLSFEPLSDHHIVIAEFRSSDDEPWARCPVVRVGEMRVRMHVVYPPGIQLQKNEGLKIACYALDRNGQRNLFSLEYKNDFAWSGQSLTGKVFYANRSCFAYLLHGHQEIFCYDPQCLITVQERYPIAYEVVPPEQVSCAGPPLRIAAIHGEPLVPENLMHDVKQLTPELV